MNNCRNCKHAEWARTKNGRINPHQAGQCTWSKSVHVASSTHLFYGRQENPVRFVGGYIFRDKPYEKCPTFQLESD